jgi:predicted ATPase/class 3 adenylate cyclase
VARRALRSARLHLPVRGLDNPSVTVAQPSGTVTLVFTDIEGSTRLLEKLGVDAYRDALAEHRRIVREACVRFSGYEVDYEGDAFFYAFGSATDAVAAVSAFMEGLQDGPIRVRVGVHTGEPGLDPPKYVGLDVHRAARIMSSAHGGQVVLSPSTVALLEPDSVQLKELGRHRLKDLTAPISLHQLVVDGLDTDFPPLKTVYRSNLPVPATPFLGREKELREVVERLTHPDTRLLTLTGPGGTGKTRLALQAAAEVADDFPDGVFWVPLAPLRDHDLVVSAVAAAIGAHEQPGVPLADVLASFLTDRRMLVVVDNAEHLLPRLADDLAALLAACHTPTLLVTSRERLQITNETAWPVSTLTDTDGERLFIERADAVGVHLRSDDTVRELCHRLDQLPLAIELAAARTTALSPRAILERLDPRLAVLTTRARDIGERQRTLEATITWSYDLLDPDAQRVLRALSVFAGGCTLDGAEHVAHADLDTIGSLVDKSLLRHRTDDAGQDRYWMLETIRQYTRAKLDEAAESDTAVARHRAYCVRLAAGLEPSRYGASNDEEIARFRADRDNFREALAGAIDSRDTASALKLVRYLGDLWYQAPELEATYRMGTTAIGLPGGDPVDRAYAQGRLMPFAYDLGRVGEARQLLAAAESVLRDRGDLRAVSNFVGQAGFAEAQCGNDELGLAESQRAADLARAAGDHDLEMIALHAVASAIGSRALAGDEPDLDALRRVLALQERSVAWARARGTPLDVSAAVGSMGLTRHLLGDQCEALRDMQESLRLNPVADRFGFIDLENISYVAVALGQCHRGVLLGAAARAERERQGVPPAEFDHRVLVPRTAAAARSVLGDEAYEAAVREGETITMHEAIELALGLDPADSEEQVA